MAFKYARQINLQHKYLYKRYLSNFPELKLFPAEKYLFFSNLNFKTASDIKGFVKYLTGNNGAELAVFERSGFSELSGIVNLKRNSSFAIMGILNVTPDSFSDGGKYSSVENAFRHVKDMILDGADIIDIGGESTRPGSESVSAEEQISRVIPVIARIRDEFPEVKISVDTTKVKVAEASINAGANIINDISGFNDEPEMLNFCAEKDIPLVAMHMKGTPGTMQKNPFYDDVIDEIISFFEDKIKLAEDLAYNKLILDPGIGFGKRVIDNYEIINRIAELRLFDLPVLIGLSKKSYIGKSLNLEVDQRENATVVSEVIAVQNGADIIRTHNVKNLFQARELLKFYNDPELTADV